MKTNAIQSSSYIHVSITRPETRAMRSSINITELNKEKGCHTSSKWYFYQADADF